MGKQYYEYPSGDIVTTTPTSWNRVFPVANKNPANTALSTAAEASMQVRIAHTMTARKLYVSISANSITATSTMYTRKNGADGSMSCSIGASTTGEFEDTTHSDSLASADLYCYRFNTGASGTTLVLEAVSVIMETDHPFVLFTVSNSIGAGSTTYYKAMNGQHNANATESNQAFIWPACVPDATVSYFSANLTSNAATGTSTFRFRKNAANGNSVCSFAAGVTGWTVDTSNTDSVTANNSIAISATNGGGGSIAVGSGAFSTDGPLLLAAARASASTKRWSTLTSNNFTATESAASHMRVSFVGMLWGGIHARIDSNSRNGTCSLSLRMSGTNKATVSITASTSGDFQETSTTFSPNSGSDDIYWEADFAQGSSGSLTLQHAGSCIFPAPYAKMAASAGMSSASILVAASYSAAKMAASALSPSATYSESSPNINAAGALMAATASLKDLAGYARVDLGAVMAATAAGKDPVVALVETGFQQMAATATMPSATETEGQFIAAEQMAATAGEPSAAVSADVTMATLAATAQLDAMNPSQGVAMQAMAATADVVEMTIAEQLTLAKMAASAALKDALAAQGLAAQLWTAAASFPDAAVSLNLPVALWAATAQMSNPTVAQSAFAALMSATASLLTVAVPDGLIYRPRVRLGGGAGVVTKTPSGVVVRQKNSAGVVVRSGKLSGGIVS